MLVLVVGFFALIIAVNVTMAYFALGSWTGLVVKSSYVAGQNFNQNTAASRAENQAAGWSLKVNETKGALKFHIRDKNQNPVSEVDVQVVAQRPVHENADMNLAIAELGSGVYQAAEALDHGVWNLKITISDDHHTVVRLVRVVVEPDR